MINKVILIGNLGKDPEVRHLESGAVVAKFPIATNENYKDKNGEWQQLTEWHDIVMWRGLAERAERMLSKGKLIFVEGKLTHRKWQDKEGIDRYTTEVVANTFRLLERREVMGGDSGGGYFPSANDEKTTTSAVSSSNDNDDNNAEEDDDLPF